MTFDQDLIVSHYSGPDDKTIVPDSVTYFVCYPLAIVNPEGGLDRETATKWARLFAAVANKIDESQLQYAATLIERAGFARAAIAKAEGRA